MDQDTPEDLTTMPGEHKLPNGTTIYLADFIAGAYYSAIELDPDAITAGGLNHPFWEAFSYSVSQKIAGTGRVATLADTNIPRAGYIGLPREWEFWTVGWRARCDRALTPEIEEFAAGTQARLVYHEKTYHELPLLELLRGEPPQTIKDDDAIALFDGSKEAIEAVNAKFGFQTVRIQENLGYKVMLQSTARACKDLVEYLNRPLKELDREQEEAVIRLDALKTQQGPLGQEEIDKIVRLIRGKPRTIRFWVFLDGLGKRPVV